ncbi:hypothetical protein, partial [Dialister hominis]|uniref:hypothetical protein n=1 Tax=Dialister hominis TaxID=2582419 RepID=UPI003AF0B59C
MSFFLEDVRNIAFQGRRPVLTLPWKGRAYGRDGIKKGFKQIRLEIFSLFLLKPASARKGAANAAERSAVNIKIPGGNSISSAEGWFACFPFAKQISGINLPRRGRRATKWRLGLIGDADKKLDQLTEVSGGQFMYSHEERLKAVKLHVDSGMGLKGIMRTL